jgi:hypothetical protein
MDKHTDTQVVNLWGLEQGQFMTVVLTGATAGGNCVLEFKNGSDTNWSIDPSFTGTVTGGILVQRVKCLSAHSRIRFLSNPAGTPYWISLVWDAVPQF